MNCRHILRTGQTHCYNEDGEQIDCQGSGQDTEFQTGIGWPLERFETTGDHLVQDGATGLIWTRNCCPSDFPLSWQQALDFVEQLNKEARYGRSDWRIPNRRELRSLVDHDRKKPVLAKGHPFLNAFLGWYWTSTTAAIAKRYAWYVHLEGGRMFYGNKDGYYWVWPVCGSSDLLPRTGAVLCYDACGLRIPCDGSRQDGSMKMGVPWPKLRFRPIEVGVLDELTGLIWNTRAIVGQKTMSWREALAAVNFYGKESNLPWRMPTINELESLVDASTHSPALPKDHQFSNIQQSYWSSTTSSFETDWAYVLYLEKGAVGVGYKKNSDFALWPVMSMQAE